MSLAAEQQTSFFNFFFSNSLVDNTTVCLTKTKQKHGEGTSLSCTLLPNSLQRAANEMAASNFLKLYTLKFIPGLICALARLQLIIVANDWKHRLHMDSMMWTTYFFIYRFIFFAFAAVCFTEQLSVSPPPLGDSESPWGSFAGMKMKNNHVYCAYSASFFGASCTQPEQQANPQRRTNKPSDSLAE